MTKSVTLQTEGQRQMINARKSCASIALAIGVSAPTVAKWRDGFATPKEKHRRSLRAHLGVDFDAWDRKVKRGTKIKLPALKRGRKPKVAPAVEEAAPPAAPKKRRTVRRSKYPDPPDGSASILDQLNYSLACIRIDLRGEEITTATRSKLRADESRTLGLIAKMRREEELKEDKYVRNHPAFREHCLRILKALRPFPEASKAVAAELSKHE